MANEYIDTTGFTEWIADERMADPGHGPLAAKPVAAILSLFSRRVKAVREATITPITDSLSIMPTPFSGKEEIDVDGQILRPDDIYGKLHFDLRKTLRAKDLEALALRIKEGDFPDINCFCYATCDICEVEKARKNGFKIFESNLGTVFGISMAFISRDELVKRFGSAAL